jgi:hypothetical protein
LRWNSRLTRVSAHLLSLGNKPEKPVKIGIQGWVTSQFTSHKLFFTFAKKAAAENANMARLPETFALLVATGFPI